MTAACWKLSFLGDHCEIISGFPFKSAGFTDDPDDVALVKGENVGQGQVLWDIAKRWPREDFDDLRQFELISGDVVLAMDRPWIPAGLKFGKISETAPQALLVQRVARLRARGGLEQSFLLHLIASPRFVAYVQNIGRGVGVPHISGKEIGAFDFSLPPKDVQRKIADILSSYDDLIENNRRRMALLEESALLLYREWFVRLRFPGHEHTRIVDGVPEGWLQQPISELVVGIYDGPHATPPSADEGPVFLGIKNISESGRLDLTDVRHIAENDFPQWTKRVQPRAGDVVFSYEATLHRYALIPPGFCGCLGRRLALIRPDPDRKNGFFLFQSLLGERWKGIVEANIISGATVDRIPIGKLPNFPLLMPPDHLVRGFEDVASGVYRQIQTLAMQNDRLKVARDLLLPRLMSGEIAV